MFIFIYISYKFNTPLNIRVNNTFCVCALDASDVTK